MPFNLDQPNYQRFRNHYAERRREIVFWVGAGASADSGLPVWPVLRNALILQSLETSKTLSDDAGKILDQKLEIARVESSLWNSFQMIKDAVGPTDFREAIKEVFKNTSNLVPPDIYQMIWNLKNVTGMLSFNIDGFAIRSHRMCRSHEDVISATGRNIPDYVSAISMGRPFVADLHGQRDAPGSWVFTRNEIDSLIKTQAYRQFIEYIFMSRTVVFIGISADDIAAGSFLDALNANGLDFGPHYWITDRLDTAAQSWAQREGVSLIRYRPEVDPGGRPNHTVVLARMFEDLNKYVSKDKKASPIVPDVPSSGQIPSVKDLKKLDDDEIRQHLTSYAKDILDRNDNNTNSADYIKFLKDYSPAIHQSWHVTEDEPYNKFFGYTVIDRVSRSGFSNVWRATDAQGNNVAIKIIQIDNLNNGAQIDSFRRGIDSLGFLTNAGVPGTPQLIEAREIPTAFVMSFVEGRNISDLALQSDFSFWRDGLPIFINVCDHLKYSHNLPQGVLHRDVRPSNIMVPEFNWSPIEALDYNIDRYKAVLLNYDMSWHVNARGETISGKLEEAGFYAPELLVHGFGSIARRTFIDSYGVGMSLYYCYTKQVPPSAGSNSKDWNETLNLRFRPATAGSWRSAAERLRRLIVAATEPNDEDRDTIDTIKTKLITLNMMVKGLNKELPASVWAEELMSRAVQSSYNADESEQVFTRSLKIGRTIVLQGLYRRAVVELKYSNAATEHTDRASGKLWGEKLRAAQGILQASGWKVDDGTTSSGKEIKISATIPLEALSRDIVKAAKDLTRALDQVRLD